jgi:flagellar hook-length control protein FliK
MRIEVRIKEKGLYCTFMVSEPRAKKILEQALPEVSLRLHQVGYEPFFQVSVEAGEKISPSLIPDFERWSDSLFNVVV